MARVRIAELQYNVKANTSDFSRGMRQAERQLRAAQRAVRDIGEAITKIFAPATAAVIGLAVAGQRLGNSLMDVSEELRITTTGLQALRQLTAENGETNERLSKSLRNVTDRTAQAAAGNQSMLKHFRALNINIDEFIELPLERQLEAIAVAQELATDRATAHSAVMGIVGTFSGPKMMRTLRDLAKRGYGEVEQSARRAGMVMSEQTIAKMAEIDQVVSDLMHQIRVFGAEVAIYVIRPLEELDKRLGFTRRVGELTAWFGALDEQAKELIGTIALLTAVIGPLILALAALITPLITLVGLWAKLKLAFLAGWAAIKAGGVILASLLTPITAIVVAITAAVAATLAFTNALDGVGKSLIGERLTVQLKIFSLRFLQTAADWGLEVIRQLQLIPRYVAAAVGTAFAYVNWEFRNGLIDTVVEVGGRVLAVIGGAFQAVGESFFSLLEGLFTVFVNSAKVEINRVIERANRILPVNIGTFDVDEGKTMQGAIKEALKPITDALLSPSQQTGDTFDLGLEFRNRLGDTKTGIPGMVSDLQVLVGDGMDKLIETQEQRLKKLDRPIEAAAESVNEFNRAVFSATESTSRSAEYSDEARELAQRTLDEIKAGRLSTTKDTRLEAEAILRGEAIYGDSVRFRKFATMDRPDASYVRDGAAAVGLGDWSSLDAGPSWERHGRSLISGRERQLSDSMRSGEGSEGLISKGLEGIENKLDELAEGWRRSFAPN